MKVVFMSLALISPVFGGATAAPIHFQSGMQQVSLLELYTSEGCSSCPPAETWLNRLKDSPDLWKNFAPVAFHVDYWNSSAWKDRWSAPEYSERQRAYAQAWNADNIYTPCFVLNGKEWHGWLFRRSVPTPSENIVGVLAVSFVNTNLCKATFIPAKPADTQYEIHAALLVSGLGSDVKGGENSGRHLNHEFATLNLVQMRMATSQGMATARFILDTHQYQPENTQAITVWVTYAGQIEPLQTTGGWLVPPPKK